MTQGQKACWYAISCRPRKEALAEENLLRQGFHVYLPRIRIPRRRRGRWVDVVEVLFPRYIFIQIDPLQRSTAPVRSTRGVVDLVRFGGQPAVVPNAVMNALKRREDPDSGLHYDSRPPMRSGEPIKLIDGPFAGMDGVFAQEDGQKRVIVLLELLGKANQISVRLDWIARAA